MTDRRSIEISGKKAVVVGGASGMARATAELLRQKGADVAILDMATSQGRWRSPSADRSIRST